jgi:hypothetical protein
MTPLGARVITAPGMQPGGIELSFAVLGSPYVTTANVFAGGNEQETTFLVFGCNWFPERR